MHKEHTHHLIWRKLHNASLSIVRASTNRGNSDHFLRHNHKHIYKDLEEYSDYKKMVEPKKCTFEVTIKKVQKYN